MEVRDAVTSVCGKAWGILLYAKEEFGTYENRAQSHFNCAIKGVCCAGLFEEVERGTEIGVSNRTTVGTAHQGAED